MTVQELIDRLEKLPRYLPVHYTYDSITQEVEHAEVETVGNPKHGIPEKLYVVLE